MTIESKVIIFNMSPGTVWTNVGLTLHFKITDLVLVFIAY